MDQTPFCWEKSGNAKQDDRRSGWQWCTENRSELRRACGVGRYPAAFLPRTSIALAFLGANVQTQLEPYFGRSGIHLPSTVLVQRLLASLPTRWRGHPIQRGDHCSASALTSKWFTHKTSGVLREAAGVQDCGDGANNFVRTLGNERRDESKSCVCGSTADTFPHWIWYVLCLSFPVVVSFHFKSNQSDSKTHARKKQVRDDNIRCVVPSVFYDQLGVGMNW